MDHVQSIEELMQEIDRLKALLQTKENELDTRIANRDRIIKFKFPPNKKVKTNSQIGRLFGVSKDMINTIQSNFSKVAKKFKKAFNDYQANKEGANFQAHSEAINQNYNYDASIDEIIENFSKSLKEQQEKLNLKREKKQKASRVSARVTLSPKLLMNKVKKNFNKAKIVIMHQASSLSYTYGEYKERKAYERNQELADDLQYEVEKERVKQRKFDFKAAIKAEKKEEKLRLKEEQKIKIDHAKASIITMPFVLINSVKKNFNKAKIALMVKANNLSVEYNEYRERKAYERDQDLADDLQYEVEKERIKQRKSDFKAAIKEHNKEVKKEKREVQKQRISSALCYVCSLPKSQLNKVRTYLGAIQSKYGELYQELADHKEEKAQIKNQKLADKLQAKVEKTEHKQHKSDFKAAIKAEKQEEKERRHQAILDMIKALDQEQQQELESQRAEISNLQSEIMYNMREGGGRRR